MVQMWLSPRDLCALAATAAARARLSGALATRMGLSSAAPEVLFAMAAFHKFYQRTYERCVNDAGSRVDQHQLVEAPELVHRILEALGFCTFLDEDGVERPLRDERGRPVCAFLGDLRHAFATNLRRQSFLTLALDIRNLPARLQEVKSQLQELRPKKSSLFLGKLRIWDLDYNLSLWQELNRSMLNGLDMAERWINDRLDDVETRKYLLRLARGNLAQVMRSTKTVLASLEKLPEHRQARIEARNMKSTRDEEAEQWRTNFKNFINNSWIPLVQTMDLRAQEGLDSIKPSVELQRLGSRSEEPAPRSDSTAAPGPQSGPEPVPSKNFAAVDPCFQLHGHNKQRCDSDLACHFEPAAKPGGQGSCRLKSASPSSPGGPFVSADIGDTPRKTKPPASSSIEKLESLAAAPPPNTRKERKEAAKEAAHMSETERNAEAAKIAAEDQNKATKQERRRIAKIHRTQRQQEAAKIAAAKQEQRRKATKAAKIAKTQTCGQLEEQEACIARQDCTWRPEENACVAVQKGDKQPKQSTRRSACAALDKKNCKGSCVWDDLSEQCIPTTLRTEDLRSQPFSPLRASESPALPEPEPKPAASAAKPSRRALRWTALPSALTVVTSFPGAGSGSGGAEASLRAPPAATAPFDSGSGGAEVSMPPLTPAASAALHGSMHSSLENPARKRKEQLRRRSPTEQQRKKDSLLASHVGTAVAFIAALATGKLRR